MRNRWLLAHFSVSLQAGRYSPYRGAVRAFVPVLESGRRLPSGGLRRTSRAVAACRAFEELIGHVGELG